MKKFLKDTKISMNKLVQGVEAYDTKIKNLHKKNKLIDGKI